MCYDICIPIRSWVVLCQRASHFTIIGVENFHFLSRVHRIGFQVLSFIFSFVTADDANYGVRRFYLWMVSVQYCNSVLMHRIQISFNLTLFAADITSQIFTHVQQFVNIISLFDYTLCSYKNILIYVYFMHFFSRFLLFTRVPHINSICKRIAFAWSIDPGWHHSMTIVE